MTLCSSSTTIFNEENTIEDPSAYEVVQEQDHSFRIINLREEEVDEEENEQLSSEAMLKAKRLDVSCSSGHTASTQALSDYEDDDNEEIRCGSPLFNTHTSILNVTTSDEEEEDDDDDENDPYGNLLDDSMMMLTSSSTEFAPVEDSHATWATEKNTTSVVSSVRNDSETSGGIMDRVGDLMDSWCAPVKMMEHYSCKDTNETSSKAALPAMVVEHDLFKLLSCLPPPDAHETKLISSNTQSYLHRLFCMIRHDDDDNCTIRSGRRRRPPPPHKNNIQQRCRKIKQLLQARRVRTNQVTLRTVQSLNTMMQLHATATPTTITGTQHYVQRKQDLDDDIYDTTDPTTAGYDSDPEDIVWTDKRFPLDSNAKCFSKWSSALASSKVPSYASPANVELTMNSSWDLLWHNNNTSATTTMDDTTTTSFQTVHVWMERGTLIHSRHMIEPRLMWRTHSLEIPMSIWLLQISRIRACGDSEPFLPLFAQPSNCLVLRTHDQSCYFFQARDSCTRDAIVTQWKSAIARFAALAVLEDATTILNEFFVVPQVIA